MPSGEVAAVVDAPVATATKTPFPYVTEVQAAVAGRVLATQVMPSNEYEAFALALATATKTPLPKVTEVQFELDERVLVVQVIASVDVEAFALPLTATKVPFPKVTELQDVLADIVLAVATYETGVTTGTTKAPSAV